MALARRGYSWSWCSGTGDYNKELCQVIWGIIIKNFMHKYSFIVTECCGRFKIPSALIFCPVDREGSGRINLPALRCREFSSERERERVLFLFLLLNILEF